MSLPDHPSTRRQTVAVVVAGFGQNIVLVTVSTFVLLYLLQYAGISTTGLAAVTAIIGISKIVDAVLDPFMGGIIDMTRSRWGKLRPYILFSALPVALLSGLMFSIPDTSEALKITYFGVIYVLWSLAYTATDVPFWGLIGSAFVDSARTRVIGFVRAFGAIALGLATLGMPWLARLLSFGPETTSSGWSLAVFTSSLIGMAMFLMAFFFTRERVTTAVSAGLSLRQIVTALVANTPLLFVLLGSALGFGRYIIQSGGAVFVVVAYAQEGAFTLVGAAIILGMVVASFATPPLVRLLTGRTLMIASTLAAAAIYLAMFVAGFSNLLVVIIFIFFTGLTLGVFLVVQATMIADAVDDAERRLGVRNDGISFSTLTFVNKLMTATAILVFGSLVVIAGYESGAVVTSEMQDIVFASITLVPAISCVVSVVPFFFYRLGRPSALSAV